VAKRVDLEQENLSHLGRVHVQERCRRIWDIARAKVAIAADNLRGNGSGQKEGASVPYILESLSIEHEKAYCKYEPRPYYGEVALFRASKQLKGIIEDTYLGWLEFLRGPLHIVESPGHQQNILLPPNVACLARQLTERLQTAQQR
jgi:hypothetical protein